MATLKLTIDAVRSCSDGRFPVIYRLTNYKQTTRIGSGVKVLKQDWDTARCRVNKSHPESKELNLILSKRLLELEKKLLQVTSTGNELNITELKEALITTDTVKRVLFVPFADKEIKDLRDKGKFGNAQSYETAINRLIKFTGKDLTLDMITYSLLSDFDTQLLKEGLSRNSVAVYMREIRALLNKAIHKKLLEHNQYPFHSYKIKTEKTVSRAVSKNELMKLLETPLEEQTPMWHSRNIFFLIFNLIGISFIDLVLLTPDSIQDERIVYKRRKTGKIYSIKLTSEAKRILALYHADNSKYLMSIFKLDDIPVQMERLEIGLRLKVCNKHLTKLGKLCKLPIPLTTYVARYTWGNVAKSLGFPKDQIAESYGHQYGNRITGIYLDAYGDEVLDSLNEKVCSSVQL